jgi:uncharacterized ion transporter superfamily protein YfcC
MRIFLRYIELFLSGLGLIVILVVPNLIQSESLSKWQVASITATFVGVIHGIIFWLIRRRQRLVRNETISEVREMLRDIINNNLAVIALSSQLYGVDARKAKTAIEQTERAIENISKALDTISEESLRSWRSKYM